MTNQPLSSNEHGKILIFSLLMAPAIFFVVGIIPAIFLLFGIYMMKKDKSFSSIETAVKLFKGYAWLLLIGCVVILIYNSVTHSRSWEKWYETFEFHFFSTFTCLSFAYFIFVQKLFYKPLKNHEEWVEANGIFSTKQRVDSQTASQTKTETKGKNSPQFSVADELDKWIKLKEDGHITETEFNDARTKLLERN